jgi:large subunit ribosomal protein L25
MDEIKLEVQIRSEIGSGPIKVLRKKAFVPAVVYGGDSGPTTIKVDRRAYEKITRSYVGQNLLFHLNVNEGEKKLRDYSVLVQEEQHHPVTDALLHIDFKRISLTDEIEVKVVIEAQGDAPGVKNAGGSLDQPLWELDVICLPTKIPAKIVVDVSALNIGDAIHVKDVVLPEGVKTEHDPEAVVFSVVPPEKEELEPLAGGEAGSIEPEVIKEKKDKAVGKEADSGNKQATE